MRKGNTLEPNTKLCIDFLSTPNIEQAIKKVETNKGSYGVDGMRVEEVREYLAKNLDDIRKQIITRKYKPAPARRVLIPKGNGKTRPLGIPIVIDRVLQQALVQVLSPVFEPTFSDFSYGFRPNRSAEDAVRQAQMYIAEGYTRVIDIDMAKFFDTLNHDKLIGFIDKTLKDKDIRRLIYVYLKSGVLEDNEIKNVNKGVMQGGPLSPLLANIYLTPFDRKLENKKLHFVRYADDTKIFVKSRQALKRVSRNSIKFLENELKLTVNNEKTYLGKAEGSTFLGMQFKSNGKLEYGVIGYIVPSEKAIKRFKTSIREKTKRNRGTSLERVISEVNSVIRGWISYFGRTNMTRMLKDTLMPWVRRRIRQYAYKIWKTKKNRIRKLRQLGIGENMLKNITGFTSNSYWKASKSLSYYITNAVIHNTLGLVNGVEFYKKMHQRRKEVDKFHVRPRYEEIKYQNEFNKLQEMEIYKYDCISFV